MSPSNTPSNHTWKFFRAGGFDQVRLDSGADFANLDSLDQKLWVALACPTTGLHFDPKTAALLDTDKDGRIRAPEVIAAAQWACRCLKNPDDLLKGTDALALSAINDATPEGKQILSSARQILVHLGKKEATTITLEDTTDTTKILAQTNFNGDGIVTADAAEQGTVKAVIADIIACLGAETDRSGKPGVSQAKADQFFAEAQAYSDWWKKSEVEPAILPAGTGTAAAAAAVKAVKAKVDDYFTRCRLAAFDARAINALNREEKEYLAMAAKDLTITSAEIAGFPLARVEAGRPLALKEGLNPAWTEAVSRLLTEAVKPLLGERSSLTEAEWGALQAKLGAFEAWSAGKAGATVEKLGLKRVRDILAGPAKAQLDALLVKDKAEEANVNAIAAVDKLLRCHRDLNLLCTNFVNFKDFYDRGDPAIFQAGTLYLDQRSCDLCLTVEDAAKHASMAGLAGTYLAYCDCARKGSGEKLQIAAAFTDGDSDNLMVGRNGIFYDRKGRDWDATITKIIDNPISIRQAFWSPYKKLIRMIEEQIAKRAAAADAAAQDKLAAAAKAAAEADKARAVAEAEKAKAPEPKKMDVGVVAALGVAFGAIGTAVSALATGIFKLPYWQVPLVFVGIILLISGPSMVIACLKLRKRNLGPLLDANGWAVNAKARINLPFGRSLTEVAALPAGAQRDLTDPYAEKKSPWPTIIVVVILLWIAYAVLNGMGYIHEWTHGRLGQPRVVKVEIGKETAPAAAGAAQKAADAAAKPVEAAK
jgi:hypothetical protein